MTFSLLALIVIPAAKAVAAGITISSSHVGEQAFSVTAKDLKLAACDGLSLTQIISGSGTLTGTKGNDLIIGSTQADTIDGLNGNDCILDGAGDDILTGNEGTDICLSGPGNDIFTSCEGESQ